MSETSEFSKKLAVHFQELKSQRDGATVFLIEHDLDRFRVNDLLESVSADLKHRGLNFRSRGFEHCIPLLVAATEIAYEYEGNGTDYWPKLDR